MTDPLQDAFQWEADPEREGHKVLFPPNRGLALIGPTLLYGFLLIPLCLLAGLLSLVVLVAFGAISEPGFFKMPAVPGAGPATKAMLCLAWACLALGITGLAFKLRGLRQPCEVVLVDAKGLTLLSRRWWPLPASRYRWDDMEDLQLSSKALAKSSSALGLPNLAQRLGLPPIRFQSPKGLRSDHQSAVFFGSTLSEAQAATFLSDLASRCPASCQAMPPQTS